HTLGRISPTEPVLRFGVFENSADRVTYVSRVLNAVATRKSRGNEPLTVLCGNIPKAQCSDAADSLDLWCVLLPGSLLYFRNGLQKDRQHRRVVHPAAGLQHGHVLGNELPLYELRNGHNRLRRAHVLIEPRQEVIPCDALGLFFRQRPLALSRTNPNRLTP